jgi:hypothetical protein
LSVRVSGRNRSKTYGKAYPVKCGTTFPRRSFVGKVQDEIEHIFKRLLQLPTFPRDTVFGKVMTRCQVVREIISLKEIIAADSDLLPVTL